MKSCFYIISGWYDTTGRAPYQRLAEIARSRGYSVVKINPEWDEPLSGQIFPVTRRDVVFGFSMGAILACMVGKRQACRKLILASMTPILDLSRQTINLLGRPITSDFKKFKYHSFNSKTTKATYLYGDREVDCSLDGLKKQIFRTHDKAGTSFKIIPNTCHVLNATYIEQIAKEL